MRAASVTAWADEFSRQFNKGRAGRLRTNIPPRIARGRGEQIMPKRIKILVFYVRSSKTWALTAPGQDTANFHTKAVAVRMGRDRGLNLWAKNVPAQLLVKGKRTGRFELEATYGHDPRKTKG